MTEKEKKQSIILNAELAQQTLAHALFIVAAAAKTPECGGEVAVLDVESHQKAIQEIGVAGTCLMQIMDLTEEDNGTETEV